MDGNLFYLAGLVSGDGHLEKGRNRIDIRITEPEFAKSISETYRMHSPVLDLPKMRVRITSQHLVGELTTIFEIPKGNKSRTIQVPEAVVKANSRLAAEYLAGWFDAEGSLSFRKRKTIDAYPEISFCVCNEKVCESVRFLLEKAGLKPTRVFSSTSERFFVKLNGRREVRKFLQLIPVKHSKWTCAVAH